MEQLRFFQAVNEQELQPRCKGCHARLDYGVTTEWNDELETQVCSQCRTPV